MFVPSLSWLINVPHHVTLIYLNRTVGFAAGSYTELVEKRGGAHSAKPDHTTFFCFKDENSEMHLQYPEAS